MARIRVQDFKIKIILMRSTQKQFNMTWLVCNDAVHLYADEEDTANWSETKRH